MGFSILRKGVECGEAKGRAEPSVEASDRYQLLRGGLDDAE